MCGIVGIVHKDRQRRVDESRLDGMRDLLVHRGPDDAGSHVDGHVGLGHRRLAIIDLSSGHQPMTNEDGTLWIVFNGEIYNFQSLREMLVGKGHQFKTKSDTEVILHLYEEEGRDCARSLNGIFAFAIWDARDQSLFLARDHMGVKPLYYAVTDEALVFASEIKSIVNSGYVEPRCRDEGAFEYFVFRHVSGARTLYRDVNCLLPAHTLVLKDGEVRIDQFWSHYPKREERPANLAGAAEELSTLIQDAVGMQMVSDVPLGTFCSGGVDSSLVTAFAARLTEKRINTFSVGFHESDYDETQFARLVSKQYGTIHHELKLGNEEFADLLPTMIWHNDAPLNFANSIQIYAISKLAKEFVTVVLTGEGADELFAGYPRYLVPSLSHAYGRLPEFVKRFADRYAQRSGNHRLEKISRHARYRPDDALLYNSGFLDPEFARDMLEGDFGDDLAYRRSCLTETSEMQLDRVSRLSLLDQKNYLVSILERQDKMSMAASIESRVPFLDHRIVEFANSLPVRFKTRRFETKAILKQVARKFLPAAVVDRRKSGFGVPLRSWLGDPRGLGRYLDGLQGDQVMAGYVNQEKVAELIRQHRSGSADHSEFLWTAINFMLWTKAVDH